jgi:ABC-2 type transport system permease protein
MPELVRAAFVIGRRDFTATVFSRAFLLFLLGPLFPVVMGLLFGTVGGRVAAAAEQPVVAVVATTADYDALAASRQRLARAFSSAPLVRLRRIAPDGSPERQRQKLLAPDGPAVLGVLEGGLDQPRYTGSLQPGANTAAQLRLIIEDARRTGEAAPTAAAPLALSIAERSSGAMASHRALTAQAGQMILFLLTILLAGMLLSQLIEEKSNKIIEVLAAAVPIDAIFLGKLCAMLMMSLIGIAVWTGAGAAAVALWSDRGLAGIAQPAVGWGAFLALCFLYFAMSYLLLGALFLAIGAQASTVREVQTLSMPVTMAQVVIFALAAAAIGNPNSPAALGAALFPLSSPYVMIARAAELPQLWPHALAILWQAMWVLVILRLGARLFRRSVLKSGPAGVRWPWRRQLTRA